MSLLMLVYNFTRQIKQQILQSNKSSFNLFFVFISILESMKIFRFFYIFIIFNTTNFYFTYAFYNETLESLDILDPAKIRHYKYTQQITGKLDIFVPKTIAIDTKGNILWEEYQIQMKKVKQQFLPKDLYGNTTIYAYGGQTKDGYKIGFPGPAIFVQKDRKIKVKWKNLIQGKHILPIDFSYPFKSDEAFQNEVPAVPHAHGIATPTSSDGQPEAYWTYSGKKSSIYQTQQPCAPNQAVYFYPNEQQSGNYWYHDHAIGITRINVYAGLVGFYKILDSQSVFQQKIIKKYGIEVNQNETKYLVVVDRKFKNNGELYYTAKSRSPYFMTWQPQFYGNMLLVNGVIWPKMTLKKGKHRFVFLNGCQSRYLNIFFDNDGKILPFDLIRIDGDYYQKPVRVTQYLAISATRAQFILDLSRVQGQVILRNNHLVQYPYEFQKNIEPQFTGQILKIYVLPQRHFLTNNQLSNDDKTNLSYEANDIQLKSQRKYPYFDEGQPIFTVFFKVSNQNGHADAIFIDGMSMKNGRHCQGSFYQIGKTYDFHMINITPDSHPMHFHLVNVQKVRQYPINVENYYKDYMEINGGYPDRHGFAHHPKSLDPAPYRIGNDELPFQHQKVFCDTVDTKSKYVTIVRIKFSKNDGTPFKSFNLQNQRYVWHCHYLQHQDNEMMKYFCLK